MLHSIWKTYSEFYRGSKYGKFPQEHRDSQGHLQFRMILSSQGPHDFVDPVLAETVLSLPLSVDSNCNWVGTYRGSSHRLKAEPSRMLVIPAELESRWEVDSPRTLLLLTVPNQTVRKVLGPACPREIGSAFSKLAEETWTDPLVEVLMTRLWENSAGSEAADVYLADGLLVSILSQLLIKAGTSLHSDPIALPQWRLKRVKAYVEAHIGEDIDVVDLAAAAGLSQRHFARSFLSEIGETPHRWLMLRRLEKAKDLLTNTDHPLCSIAESCGFSSQSHLTTALKQSNGMTPDRWRRHFHV
jgi:AraC family transcriptional regulator